MSLKTVSYPGFHGFDGEVAYHVAGRDVYFTALKKRATSTINAAEAIIAVISREERTPWRDLTFYDVRTHRGYHHRKGWFVVERLSLKVEGKRISDVDWITVARCAFPRVLDDMELESFSKREIREYTELGRQEAAKLPGIPAEVLALFQCFIDE